MVIIVHMSRNRRTRTLWHVRPNITKTRLFKYIENFSTKTWKFSVKTSDNFHISAQNIDCGYSLEPPRRGGSNEYPQSTFLSRNKKNNVYPCKPQFIKVGFAGSKLYRRVFVIRRLKLACASVQSVQSSSLAWINFGSLAIKNSNAQACLNLRWAHMSEDTFSDVRRL